MPVRAIDEGNELAGLGLARRAPDRCCHLDQRVLRVQLRRHERPGAVALNTERQGHYRHINIARIGQGKRLGNVLSIHQTRLDRRQMPARSSASFAAWP